MRLTVKKHLIAKVPVAIQHWRKAVGENCCEYEPTLFLETICEQKLLLSCLGLGHLLENMAFLDEMMAEIKKASEQLIRKNHIQFFFIFSIIFTLNACMQLI